MHKNCDYSGLGDTSLRDYSKLSGIDLWYVVIATIIIVSNAHTRSLVYDCIQT